MKKNIMILAGYYLPGIKGGGPIKSIANLVSQFNSKYNFYIVAYDRDLGDKSQYKEVITDKWINSNNSHIYYVSKNELSTKRIINIINSVEVDFLYLNSLFDIKFSIIPLILNKANQIKVSKIILAPRGGLSEGALKLKKHKKFFFIKLANFVNLFKNIIWHATAETEKKDIMENISGTKEIFIANNLTTNYNNVVFSKNITKNEGEVKIIFLSRIHPKKNLLFSLEILKNVKGNILFDIYGPIEDEEYWEKCKKTISELPNNVEVKYRGIVQAKDVVNVFSKYHVFLFPTLGENYGHVISEALIGGCPVIISDQTPWNDLERENVGYAINLKNKVEFANAIQKYIDMNLSEYMQVSEYSYEYAKIRSNSPKTISNYNSLFS